MLAHLLHLDSRRVRLSDPNEDSADLPYSTSVCPALSGGLWNEQSYPTVFLIVYDIHRVPYATCIDALSIRRLVPQ